MPTWGWFLIVLTLIITALVLVVVLVILPMVNESAENIIQSFGEGLSFDSLSADESTLEETMRSFDNVIVGYHPTASQLQSTYTLENPVVDSEGNLRTASLETGVVANSDASSFECTKTAVPDTDTTLLTMTWAPYRRFASSGEAIQTFSTFFPSSHDGGVEMELPPTSEFDETTCGQIGGTWKTSLLTGAGYTNGCFLKLDTSFETDLMYLSYDSCPIGTEKWRSATQLDSNPFQDGQDSITLLICSAT